VRESHARIVVAGSGRTPATTDRCAAGRRLAPRCAERSKLSGRNHPTATAHGFTVDPPVTNSVLRSKADQPTHRPAQRYADDRQLASASVRRSSAERLVAGANEAPPPESPSSPARAVSAPSVRARQHKPVLRVQPRTSDCSGVICSGAVHCLVRGVRVCPRYRRGSRSWGSAKGVELLVLRGQTARGVAV